jgi:(p)ppGpp synthase/HD superfamily hydrolase
VSTFERAIAVAAEAHAGQVDKAGAAYVLHPLRMMLNMSMNALSLFCMKCARIAPGGR